MRNWFKSLFSRSSMTAHPSDAASLSNSNIDVSNLGDAVAKIKGEGNVHFENGNFVAAERCYRQVIAIDPHNAKALLNLAFVLKEQGNLADAKQCAQQSITIDPALSDAQYLLGTLYQMQGQLDLACTHFHQAVLLSPEFDIAYRDLAFLLFQLNRLQEAKQILIQGLAANPASADLHFYLGNLHQEERQFDLAIANFQACLSIQSDHYGALYNAGLVYLKKDDVDQAIVFFQRALVMNPGAIDTLNNLGNAFHQKGRFDEAIASYRQGLAIEPGSDLLHYNLGFSLQLHNRLEEAIAHYRTALSINLAYADAYINLGNILKIQKKFDEAIACYRQLLNVDAQNMNAYTNLGNVLQEMGRLDDAIIYFRQALTISPDFAEGYNNLANALNELDKLDEAMENCRRALELKPDYADALNTLGIILHGLRRFDEAAANCLRALEIKPDNAGARNNFGLILMDMQQWEEAELNYRLALEIKPDYDDALSNLGMLLMETGRREEAEASYRRALEVNPDCARASMNLSFLLLADGRYSEAWPYHEARYNLSAKETSSKAPDVSFPQWHGESLDGKSLLIWHEQGFGDYIQFIRYVPMLKARGVLHLTVVCATPLEPILKGFAGIDAVVTDSDFIAKHDYWVFPLSLPLYFGTTVDTIPATLPYLYPQQERLERWKNRLPSNEVKVGLVWKGNADHKNDSNRSLPSLTSLAPLWDVSGVTFVSLQKGRGEEELAQFSIARPIILLGAEMQDFADTAAIVSHLDLMICVDTAIAHVAGAMGKPCWVLLPAFGTDWRWLRDRSDSPWYPEVLRLFKQSKQGDWGDTISEVANALQDWIALSKN